MYIYLALVADDPVTGLLSFNMKSSDEVNGFDIAHRCDMDN